MKFSDCHQNRIILSIIILPPTLRPTLFMIINMSIPSTGQRKVANLLGFAGGLPTMNPTVCLMLYLDVWWKNEFMLNETRLVPELVHIPRVPISPESYYEHPS